jgi:hypothetical protein
MPEEEKKSHNIFLYVLLLGCLVAIATSFYFFYYKKDYNFVVEVSCDPTKEICFQRDCSDPTNCPPNELSDFKRYTLNAGDFKMCENEDCTNACATGTIKCTPVACTENLDAGESCSTREASAK